MCECHIPSPQERVATPTTAGVDCDAPICRLVCMPQAWKQKLTAGLCSVAISTCARPNLMRLKTDIVCSFSWSWLLSGKRNQHFRRTTQAQSRLRVRGAESPRIIPSFNCPPPSHPVKVTNSTSCPQTCPLRWTNRILCGSGLQVA